MTGPHDIRYVRIGASDLDASIDFAVRILGLELVGREANAAYLRGDDREHNICYTSNHLGHAVGFELASADLLDRIAGELEHAEVVVERGTEEERAQRRVREMIHFSDPTGNRIELVARPAASGKRYFPGRDAGITSFSHIGLRTSDPRVDEQFWTARLGAKVSDWIGDAPLLRIDEVHHKIALFPSAGAGIQHVNFQVEGIDDIMRSYYFLQKQGVKTVFGPGRHPTSGARFLYFEGPDGMVYEYSTGVRLITADEEVNYVPRQFPKTPSSFCMWGSEPDIPEFKTATPADVDA
jgi:2,3-dihydroxy-p-cumate/2,3-dihydroxybenzoate 3,4-dioxygenase